LCRVWRSSTVPSRISLAVGSPRKVFFFLSISAHHLHVISLRATLIGFFFIVVPSFCTGQRGFSILTLGQTGAVIISCVFLTCLGNCLKLARDIKIVRISRTAKRLKKGKK
jgi:hypothetical protein